MAALTDEQKLEVVTRLARFDTPTEIVADFKQRGIVVTPMQIGAYDPTRTYFEAGEKWRDIFDAARKAFYENVAHIPIANQSYRLQILQKGIADASSKGKWSLAASLAEQASKEMGGAFTNQREMSISDSRKQRAADMTPEDRQALLADVIRKAIETMPPQPGQAPQHPTPQ